MPNPERHAIEQWLSEWFGQDHCILVGRGTTGLALIFEAANITGDVIYPSYTCQSPVFSAIYAGATPAFTDVDSDYTIDTKSVEAHIDTETEAIVAIDMFGHPARLEELESLADEYGVLLVEDACQSVGTTYRGRKTGSFGDASVLSFGSKKHIDAGGGGAILTDDTSLARRVRDLEADVPRRDGNRLQALYDHYREISYAIQDLSKVHPEGNRLFEAFPEVFEELFYKKFDTNMAQSIATALDTLPSELDTRRQHTQLYRELLSHSAITHPNPVGDPVYYRYSVQLTTEPLRNHVVEYLRDRDIHVSTLYPPVHERFAPQQECPVATRLHDHTLNLWVSSTVSETYVRHCAETILEAIEAYDAPRTA